jgi:hypothetical protein
MTEDDLSLALELKRRLFPRAQNFSWEIGPREGLILRKKKRGKERFRGLEAHFLL